MLFVCLYCDFIKLLLNKLINRVSSIPYQAFSLDISHFHSYGHTSTHLSNIECVRLDPRQRVGSKMKLSLTSDMNWLSTKMCKGSSYVYLFRKFLRTKNCGNKRKLLKSLKSTNLNFIYDPSLRLKPLVSTFELSEPARSTRFCKYERNYG